VVDRDSIEPSTLKEAPVAVAQLPIPNHI
jgi:hypothetical protein